MPPLFLWLRCSWNLAVERYGPFCSDSRYGYQARLKTLWEGGCCRPVGRMFQPLFLWSPTSPVSETTKSPIFLQFARIGWRGTSPKIQRWPYGWSQVLQSPVWEVFPFRTLHNPRITIFAMGFSLALLSLRVIRARRSFRFLLWRLLFLRFLDIFGPVLQVESDGELKIELDCPALVFSLEDVSEFHIDFGAVEGAISFIDFVVLSKLLESFL